ncbi:N-acyl-D-amino-acid deacylase family protein [Alterisphingorhabdus coralli]|uniref:Amidohydrolase family protein n=1 Tax=Alterisphingorhabdus coralli TaxID=3071408 RepID=A0AA97FB94_9SPHN|nr:amidohydrolase family protein [Parasphingorhabdus sp. SCSIO 66989]WOE75895.1 amidohydrolase family protein [Parasphingorhabdus sp. SCSIO 66989]
MGAKPFALNVGLCCLFLPLVSACATTQEVVRASPIFDILIENGTVYDGSGAPGAAASIAIIGDKIVSIESDNPENPQAKRRIDATGLIVAPGFIDPHTHLVEDLGSEDRKRRNNAPYLTQGVTTVVLGNDGYGDYYIKPMARLLAELGTGTNMAFMVGFGPVRRELLADTNRAPTDDELEQMKGFVARGMCDGAVGFSTGLYYTPQNFAETDEVVALASVAGDLGGIYDSHIRDESSYNIGLRAAVEEALYIGREADMPVHIAHIKALGPAVWGASSDIVAMVEKAQAAGQIVTADQYPWQASGTRISNALVPRWALDGGLDGLRARLTNAEERARIVEGMAKGLKRRGGADALLFTGALGEADVPKGITLAEYAQQKNIDPLDAALEILAAGDSRVASFNMDEADIATFARQPWVVTSSDGSTGHPRKYASFPKAYQRFVKRDRLFDMARYIHRSSGMTAELLGLERRGFVRAGYFADIVVFDPERFEAVADYQDPEELSQGVRYLLVNGELAIDGGAISGALAGRPLLKDTSKYAAQCQQTDG